MIGKQKRHSENYEPYPDFHLKPSRQWMDQLLHNKPSEEDLDWKINSFPEIYGQDSSETYFFDAFRQFHPERKEAFTCWNSEKNCRSTNFGTRLDYILTSNDLRGHLVTCDIHPDIQGSDHCPVSAQLAFLGKNSAKLPALCTKVIYYGVLTTKPLQDKAKLLLLKLIHLFAREVLLVKKLEIKETKTH